MLSQFIRGQLIVMVILAVLYSSAYAPQVRLAVPIGMAAGVLNFIPYLGSAFALGAGVLMSLLDGWHGWQLVGWCSPMRPSNVGGLRDYPAYRRSDRGAVGFGSWWRYSSAASSSASWGSS